MAIAGRGEIAEFAGAIGESGEHGVPMGDGFVAGEFEGAREGFCRVNGFGFHDEDEFSMARKAGSMGAVMSDIRKREGATRDREARESWQDAGLKARLYNPKSRQDAGATMAAWLPVKIGMTN